MPGAQLQNLIPNERFAAICNGTASIGTTNTNVVAFGAAAVAQGSAYPIGATHVAPVAGSGTWLNIVNDAAFGTTFKFCRRGVYQMVVRADETVANTAAFQIGITLDQALALYTVAAGTVSSATAGYGTSVLDFCNGDGLADSQIPAMTQATIYITDALAGGAQAAAVVGTQGVGVVRVIANNQANGAIGTALILASYRASVVRTQDLAG